MEKVKRGKQFIIFGSVCGGLSLAAIWEGSMFELSIAAMALEFVTIAVGIIMIYKGKQSIKAMN
jgi:hypothetical protein